MPKVLLTDDQRTAARLERMRRTIADGLAATKNHHHMSSVELGSRTCVGKNTISKVLAGESVLLTTDSLLLLLDMAGLMLKKKVDDGL